MSLSKIKHITGYLVCLIVLYSIINPLKFQMFPYLSTRMAFGMLGMRYIIKNEYLKLLTKKGKRIIGSFFSIIIMSLVTNFVNGTSEMFFLMYPFSMLIVFSACCLWLNLVYKVFGKLTQELVSHFIIMTSLLMIISAIIYFLSPNTETFIMSLLTDDFIPITEGTDLSFRLNGFGCFGYGCGIVFSMALAICVFHIIKLDFKNCKFYVISIIIIIAIGSLMSRTTLVSAAVLFFYMVLKSFKNIKILANNLFTVMFYGLVATIIISSISFSDDMMQQFSFGFEMFFNLAGSGHIETNSTNSLVDSLNIWPDNFKTWLLGDGLYLPNGGDIYMGVDNAYQRMIFYFGIIGMLLMFRYNYYMYRVTALSMKEKTLPLLFFALYFIIGIKGELLFLSTYFGLYMFYPIVNECKCVKNETITS